MPEIRLVVFDWAGTTVDHGSYAPVAAFIEAFAQHGVSVTPEETRGPMGLHKRDHIRALLALPTVAQRWRERHGRDASEADIERVFTAFMPLQLEVIDRHTQLVPGLLPMVAELRRRGVLIGTTTGYFRAAAERTFAAARQQGYKPDVDYHPELVSAGRPAPWMIFRIMEKTGSYPPSRVVKIGDTVPDIQEGRNAGVWSVGVLTTGSEVGCSEAEWADLPVAERQARCDAARSKLLAAGAHAVIDSVADTPSLLDDLNRRLNQGERP